MVGGRTGAAARRSTGTSSTASATVATIRPTMASEPQPQRSPKDVIRTRPVAMAARMVAPE